MAPVDRRFEVAHGEPRQVPAQAHAHVVEGAERGHVGAHVPRVEKHERPAEEHERVQPHNVE